MNDHTLRVLEYDKIIGIVAGFAASAAGRSAVFACVPAREAAAVVGLLQETREFVNILQSGGAPPLDGILDVGEAVGRLRKSGAVLSPSELLYIATTLGAGRRVKQFFQRYETSERPGIPQAPLLCSRAGKLHPLKHIEEAVAAAIDDQAEVRDSASPELRRIRRQLARTREDLLSRLSGILQDSGFQKVIQEPVITLRDDRYVLPLKPNYRQSLNGVVHGQSGSRSTLFVEPLAVLEQNNRLAELRMDERDEVERILRALTALMAHDAERIEATLEALIGIDIIHARARFGIEYNGVVPHITKGRGIRLRSARHPLLAVKLKNAATSDGVMPNDIILGADERALILSGPNAGGKTVVLKSMGLLALMAQSGMPITAAEGSELPCFGSIFADIGDEQSLEQDLSTFSSHVKQIADILRQADRDSLVLLDELGSGTDPNEGSALGAAVLENLIERGCVSLITTHHNALKLFGAQTSGALNAAMEFDPHTLRSTYRLIAGRPGRSYGLDMAQKLGVPETVVQSARQRIGESDARLDTLLKQMEADSLRISAARTELEAERMAAERERSEAAALLRAAREEARSLRAGARTESREILSALRQKLKELSRAEALGQDRVKEAASEIESFARMLAPVDQGPPPGPAPDLRPGDRVRLSRVNKTGIVRLVHREALEIEIDGKTVRVPHVEASLLEPVARSKQAPATPGWGADLHEEEGPGDRLYLLGFRVEDGLSAIERFIDKASMDDRASVTIIHGIGTGALKLAVTDHLKKHPQVASIRPGSQAEGGAGVTVAELKK